MTTYNNLLILLRMHQIEIESNYLIQFQFAASKRSNLIIQIILNWQFRFDFRFTLLLPKAMGALILPNGSCLSSIFSSIFFFLYKKQKYNLIHWGTVIYCIRFWKDSGWVNLLLMLLVKVRQRKIGYFNFCNPTSKMINTMCIIHVQANHQQSAVQTPR